MRPFKVTRLRFAFAITIMLSMGTLSFMAMLSYFFFHRDNVPVIEHPGFRVPSFILFAALCLILGFVSEQVVRKKVFVPIFKLNEGMKEVAKGNFKYRLAITSEIIEINEMTNSFNIMATQLASIETLRNDFINNVSHEFKTPLAAIEGYTTLLQDEALSAPERLEYLKRIAEGTRRLTTLSENILKISRLENEDYQLETRSFNLSEQLRIAILLLEREWSAKNILLDIDLEELHYTGSEELLMQVWLNLLKNAIKFSPFGGNIYIGLTLEGDWRKITIRDHGIGISEAAKKHIFDKFYQADTSHSGEGNGLGLTLANRIVDLHNGKIEVESAEGAGSEFIVWLKEPLF